MSEESTPPPPVRQRNTTPYTYNVGETKEHPAYAVLPGEIAVLPALLDGWTEVADDEQQAAAEHAPPGGQPNSSDAEQAVAEAPAKTPRKRAAVADTDKEGGEPR